jgi:hypothetical protein
MRNEDAIIREMSIGKELYDRGELTGNIQEHDYRERIEILEERWMIVGYMDALKFALGVKEKGMFEEIYKGKNIHGEKRREAK